MTEGRVLLPNRAWLDKNQREFQYRYGQIPKGVYKSIARYWNKRHTLFSRFDEGILMNEELWYSVTPEAMAIFTAKFIKACDPTVNSVLDVFCGGGGNLIQFARYFDNAYGVEFNEMNLYCAEKNCEVYGVADKVNLKLASWTDLIGSKYYKELHGKIDFIFSSPPWGGPSYKEHKVYNLETDLQPIPLKELLQSFFEITANVGLFLPKNSSWDQLSDVTRELLGEDAKCRVMFVYDQDRCKGILAFWGEKFQNKDYDYSQELEEIPYYYMSEKRRQEEQIESKSQEILSQYKSNHASRYPDRDDDDKKVQRYATGDYDDDFYDDKQEADEYQLPEAWFDPMAQRWYALDAETNETVYITEGPEAPTGYGIQGVLNAYAYSEAYGENLYDDAEPGNDVGAVYDGEIAETDQVEGVNREDIRYDEILDGSSTESLLEDEDDQEHTKAVDQEMEEEQEDNYDDYNNENYGDDDNKDGGTGQEAYIEDIDELVEDEDQDELVLDGDEDEEDDNDEVLIDEQVEHEAEDDDQVLSDESGQSESNGDYDGMTSSDDGPPEESSSKPK